MKQLTKYHKFRISEQQLNILNILKRYDIKIDCFIREAISEKLKREWSFIKVHKERRDKNDPDWLYD
jgi:hypothetical protein